METINESTVDWKEYDREQTAFRRKELSTAVDASDLGCSLYELPPGMRSWPLPLPHGQRGSDLRAKRATANSKRKTASSP